MDTIRPSPKSGRPGSLKGPPEKRGCDMDTIRPNPQVGASWKRQRESEGAVRSNEARSEEKVKELDWSLLSQDTG